MKLEEIVKINNISQQNIKSVKKILNKKTKVKGNIYKIIDSSNHIYCIIENDILISYLYLIPFENDVIKNGYVSNLYSYIIKAGFTIVSDNHQSPNGISLWDKLNKIGTIRVYDISTGNIIDKSDIPNSELYVNLEKDDKYRLILTEHIVPIVDKSIRLPELGNSILEPSTLYTYKELGLF